ncbi:PREDICTED: peroxidase 50-like isoform X1 [Brassica oleracea var. oleracea]|uniref:peroxidase 50-like isoform X1 n=1 Tax=Brassica oleracea var. oleracea TaxID=109376 RepID=UPI0006A6B271|nr:PREDICTED: peroxidase 50-like isoform X1 [Brassica oleracea var. oleracea]
MNLLSLLLPLFLSLNLSSAQLRRNFYAGSFPNVEQIVRNALGQKIQQSSITVPVVLRLYFHDCFVNGCDASVMIESTKYNKAEKDHPDNLSLSGDGFDAIVKAKQALDAVPNCRNKVSCADIITIATRDVVNIVGGPWYDVELGRLDGLSSTAASVEGMLPQPTDDVNKLTSHFAKNGLSLDDMFALSATHTIGLAHCTNVLDRIHGVKKDPSINATYLPQLKDLCPKDVDPRKEIFMDPITPGKFDNVYYQNLQQGRGLFKSDQALFTDPRSKPTVNLWASNGQLYNQAFVN